MLSYFLILTLNNILFAPLSSIMLWKRYTNFSDGFAHSLILAVVIGSFVGGNLIVGAIINSLIFVTLIYILKKEVDNNLIITIIAISMQSLGILLSDIMGININLKKILFGGMSCLCHPEDCTHHHHHHDHTTATIIDNEDIIIMTIFMIIFTYIFLYRYFKDIILMSLNKDLALSRDVPVKKIEIILLLLIVITISISIKMLGALIIFGMLIIPPTIAKLVSSSPYQMVFIATIIGIINSMIGLGLWSYDQHISLPPLIICVNFILFIFIKLFFNVTKIK